MKRQELIYDIKRLLTRSKTTDDTRLSDKHLGFLIDQRRAKEIRDSFKRNSVIEPIWLQDYGTFDLTKVNKVEDKTIAITDCQFSKAVLPAVVSVADVYFNTSDIGTFSIRGVDGKTEYHYMNLTHLSLIQAGTVQARMKRYTKIGSSIYLTPEVSKARAILILESPLDGFINDNTNKTELVVGTTYIVSSGTITHNAVIYRKDETFVAATTSFTGTGQVQLNNQKRRMTNDDPYPMSHTMWEVVKMKILSQDFQVEVQQKEDERNDSAD